MKAVLGIDAAWTERQPSGVALVRGRGEAWRALHAAPSYDAFLDLGRGRPVDWSAPLRGARPDLDAIVRTARDLAGCDVAVVAVDMPLSARLLQGRRPADNAVSRAFGARGCSAHSPTSNRPGPLARSVTRQLHDLGYTLATVGAAGGGARWMLEVYPHPALLALLERPYRVPYKVGRSRAYWPGASVPARIDHLLEELSSIVEALARRFGPIPLELPARGQVHTLVGLKRYEDAVDALVCAWVGIMFLQGRARAHGDARAAIWVPDAGEPA